MDSFDTASHHRGANVSTIPEREPALWPCPHSRFHVWRVLLAGPQAGKEQGLSCR
jgi:hypothetical protein